MLEPGKEAAILWGLSNQKRKDVKWRDIHTYITAHETGFTPGEDVVAADGTSVPGGTLTVRGYAILRLGPHPKQTRTLQHPHAHPQH